VEHSDGEGAERVGKAVGGGAPGLRRAEEALRMAAKGGPAPGAGGFRRGRFCGGKRRGHMHFRRGRFRGGKRRGIMHLVYMMVN
jgi:hypothetical protein